MLRKTSYWLLLILLMSGTAAEARGKYEFRVSGGMRFGGSFTDAGYQDNFLIEQLDIAPGAQFGTSFYIPLGHHSLSGRGISLELLFDMQTTDLRVEPLTSAPLPDSVLDRFETDGDKIILGELDVSYIHAGILYKFGTNSTWNPHVNITFGATLFKAAEGDLDRSEFSFACGGGVTKSFNETIGVRGQIRTFFTSLPSDEYWVDHYGGVWQTVDNNMFFQGELSLGLVLAF